jgi:inorganic pyrophosphatase
MAQSPATNLLSQSPFDADTGLVQVIVDTPRGSRNKYKFDEKHGLFKLSRILPAGMSFPYDFGFIPGTRAEDGDALDILVLTDAPLIVGCLVHVHLLGVIRATQTERRKIVRNDRLIGATQTKVNAPCARSLRELGNTRLQEIEQFFLAYNEAQTRQFRISGRSGVRTAHRLVKEATLKR